MRTVLALAGAGILTLTSNGAEVGYYQHPALHGDRLVFACEGDLFTAEIVDPAAPIVAYRLTASDGQESHPRISSDGRQIAFAAQYDGNTDVYVMPIDGGSPRRLTFHPDRDEPLDWSADGTSIYFRSPRGHPYRVSEAWRVSVAGGQPARLAFGPCSMLSTSATGRRFAFTRWSNERWHWKGYRGGAAPDIWTGDLAGGTFAALTTDPANDLFPMWLAGRVYFISDRTGTANLHSDLPQGGDLRQHTEFRFDPGRATDPAGYDIRAASEDGRRGASRLVFTQGGGLVLYDVVSDTATRLDVRVASDRLTARDRFASTDSALRSLALSPDGKTIVVETRGELIAIDVTTGRARGLTRTSFAREQAPVFRNDEQIVVITDAPGEPQLGVMPVDGSALPSPLTEDREGWIYPPATSPDGQWVAFADESMELHAIDMRSIVRQPVDRAETEPITDYRFSPDGRWLAYVKIARHGHGQVHLFNLETKRRFPVSHPMASDREPRWDPAGRYLYLLSDRHFDPMLDVFDYGNVFVSTTRVVAIPLAQDTPPPDRVLATAAGFDMDAWAHPPLPPTPPPDPAAGAPDAGAPDEAAPGEGGPPAGPPPMRLETNGLPNRHVILPIPPGRYRGLEAQHGAVTFLSEPPTGLLERSGGSMTPLGPGRATLHRHALVKSETSDVVTGIDSYVISRDGHTIAYRVAEGIAVRPVQTGDETKVLSLGTYRLRVDAPAEWRQMFAEAWRLQRDFFWARNHLGVDWPVMREKYEALLPRIATRSELNEVIGEMIGELGTSHTYIFGGAWHEHEEPDAVSVGLLGVDVEAGPIGVRITRIYPGVDWDPALTGPLAAPHLGLAPGMLILAVDGQAVGNTVNLLDPLQDTADRPVTLTVADETGRQRRDVVIRPTTHGSDLRYYAWVEANRAQVAAATDDAAGYIHIPDMSGRGLSFFSRQFYAQFDRPALVIDVRGNGGGFVSQMMIARLARKVVGFAQPRHGMTMRYPARAPDAHLVALIDPFAGSDGDIFPAVFRRLGLGPLIGTRTWGGVVGISGNKPFVDMGLSTQPEFAWWDEDGWSLENTGVSPDIVVDRTPADWTADRDPVLDRAIDEVIAALARDARPRPEPPPLPIRK